MPHLLDVHIGATCQLSVEGHALTLSSKRGRALLVYLAVEARPVPRAVLADLLWGPDRLANLRQALYQIRRLPHADEWLLDGPTVQVRARVQRVAGQSPRLEDLDVDTPGWLAWRDGLGGTNEGPDAHDRLLDLLALAPDAPSDVLLRALDTTAETLVRVLDDLHHGGDVHEGRLRPALAQAVLADMPAAARRLRCRQLADAWHDGPADRRAALREAAGEPDEAAQIWLDEGRRRGRPDLLERAAELAEAPALQVTCRGALALALQFVGELEPARHQARAQRRGAVALQDPLRLAEAALAGVMIDGEAGDARQVRRHLRDLADLGDALALRCRRWLAEGIQAVRAGDPEGALSVLEAAAAQAPDERLAVQAGNVVTICLGLLGRHAEATARQRDLLQRARALGEAHLIAALLNNLAATAQRDQDLEAAADRLDDLLDLLDELPAQPRAVQARYNRAWVAVQQGLPGLARTHARTLQHLDPHTLGERNAGLAQVMLGHIELECGRLAEALRRFERAAERLERDPVLTVVQGFNRKLVAHLMGDVPAREVLTALEATLALPHRDLGTSALHDVGLRCTDGSLIRAAASHLRGDALPDEVIRVLAGGDPARLSRWLPPDGAWPQHRATWTGVRALYPHEPSHQAARADRLRGALDQACVGLLTGQADALRDRFTT